MALILFLGLHGAQIGFLHFFQRRFGFLKNDVIARFLINRRADYCVYPSTSSPETVSRFGTRWLEPKAGAETRGRSHGEADVSLLLSLFLLDEAGWTDKLNQYSFIPLLLFLWCCLWRLHHFFFPFSTICWIAGVIFPDICSNISCYADDFVK